MFRFTFERVKNNSEDFSFCMFDLGGFRLELILSIKLIITRN